MAGLLTASELASMRETAEQTLAGTAVIQTEAFVSDGEGGGSSGWSASGTVPARVAPYTRGAGEAVQGERLAPNFEIIFTFPAETEITHNDRILYDGRTFEAVMVKPRTQEVTRRVGAKEVV